MTEVVPSLGGKSKNRMVISLAGGLLLLLAIGYWAIFHKEASFPYNEPAADFTLSDLEGRQMTFSESQGKARLVYFFYSSCPDVCQPTTYLLSQVQEKLKHKGAKAGFGDKTELFSVTFDPGRDTVDTLKSFSAQFQADAKGWHFLRGDEAYTIQVASKYGVGVVKQDNGDLAHQNIIILVDKSGHMRKYYNANDPDLDAAAIVKDMMALIG